MKKLFTLIAVAAMALSASAQTQLGLLVDEWPWNYETTGSRSIGGQVTVAANSQWGEYKLTNKALDMSVYKGYKVEYSDYTVGTADGDGNKGCQLKIEGTPTDLNSYVEFVEGEAVLSGDFKASTGSITTFNLQMKAKDAKIVIKKVTWIKHDGTDETADYGGKSWGVDVTGETVLPAALPMDITFKGQYGGLAIIDQEGNHQAYKNDGTDTETYNYTIELDGATTNTLMVELDGDNGGFQWLNYDAGITKIEFEISPTTCGSFAEDGTMTAKNMEKLYLKANATSGYPFTITVKSIVRTSGSAGVSAIKADAQQRGVRYNLAGQKVSDSYKGMVIMNGKKYMVK